MSDPDTLADDLRTASTRLSRRLRAEAQQSDFSDAQIAVVRRLLSDGPATASALARAEGVRPQSMAATIAALEASGIVARRPDPADRRASRVHVTDDGLASVHAGRDRKRRWLSSRLTERLDPGERATLAEAVALIDRLLRP